MYLYFLGAYACLCCLRSLEPPLPLVLHNQVKTTSVYFWLLNMFLDVDGYSPFPLGCLQFLVFMLFWPCLVVSLVRL